ncbi:Toll-Interleukin-Resistance (TIR) domain family protein [Arabidopsis thaliana]|jgi:hypothetical protein|uniref:Toll-Interleukin-Resistance (TIR) domain family protein n=2 Tax=Arabidopsis thaliana TaxID=3702 RepID=F4I871_ARATH|nr:Toll-Interleukin-Resistance (TIR) domain family protein [Arabidopsis thaliana]AEE33471.2 Toll-Interleukin-Resistance (TIR) domain family protein [Arabidopsis thaliana]|eukprot:NP_176093.2 Toll-Interleukin-Resistance (TIR) domain family protein [Arabidopsis thaliana]
MTISMVAISHIIQPSLMQLQPRVFINFRGEDIRYGFISHLVAAFEVHGIYFFIDKYEQRGNDLTYLFKRIEESKIVLAIFSGKYAQSKWCLNELATVKKLAEENKLKVIPIFYKVKVGDVRRQKGEFGRNFWNLARISSGEEIKQWKEALEFVSHKMGLELCENRSST